METDLEDGEGQQRGDVAGDHGADDAPTAAAIAGFTLIVGTEHGRQTR